ncbi:MAG: SPOR domain-containing protein [Alphaproteobacteria bacterium]|nr:SPOR domain-containing protein [Alphaproteobacteria bacterium]
MTSDHGRGQDRGNTRIEPRFDSPTAGGQRGATNNGQGSRSSFRGRALKFGIAVVALGGVAGVAWYATVQGQKDASMVVPVIHADPSPIKVLPDKPGGLEVPNRDKLVFGQITPEQQKARVEQLLPPTEKPLAKPAPPAAEKTVVAPPSGRLMPDVPDLAPRTGGDAAVGASPQPSVPAKAKTKVIDAKAKEKLSQKIAALGAFQIQFGAMKSKSKAAKEASRIARVHKSLLGKLKVTSVRSDLGKRGIYYRLRAGPLKTRAAANSLCQKFAARKMRCIVIKP